VIEPVRKQVVVETSAERAFRAFTQKIDRWWPKQHHIGASPMARAVIEPGVGGRWYAICVDGSECDTGKVLVWEPPKRVVLAWQIRADWKFDPSFVTEVEIRFTAEGPNRTHVELEHRDLDRYGAGAAALRNQIDADGGWLLIMQQYARATIAPKYLMTYESTIESRAKAPEYVAAHRARIAEFHDRGALLLTGPLADGRALGVFTTKEAAEEFVAGDPFVQHGVATAWSVLEWNEVLD
jgi:uncharacterized protein YciI/uncharacterized protein YndB with AHSA1/START domain